MKGTGLFSLDQYDRKYLREYCKSLEVNVTSLKKALMEATFIQYENFRLRFVSISNPIKWVSDAQHMSINDLLTIIIDNEKKFREALRF